MKKIIEIPVVIDMRDFHELIEVITEEELKIRLNRSLSEVVAQIINENIYFNPNIKPHVSECETCQGAGSISWAVELFDDIQFETDICPACADWQECGVNNSIKETV